jgi:hypothetical protein
MKIVFEKLAQPFGISLRKFRRAGADLAGSIEATTAGSSLGAKRAEILVRG